MPLTKQAESQFGRDGLKVEIASKYPFIPPATRLQKDIIFKLVMQPEGKPGITLCEL
jgi:hypothetical protein